MYLPVVRPPMAPALLPIILLLQLGGGAQFVSAAEQPNSSGEPPTTSPAPTSDNNEKPSPINSIQQHQEALRVECAKYHDEKIHQLEELIEYLDENPDQIQLPRPLTVKMPAVCLYLFSEFMQPKPVKVERPKALDLVDWVYDERELRRQHEEAVNKSGAGHSLPRRNIAPNPLLNEYILDPAANYSDQLGNELGYEMGPEDWAKFHRDVDGMLASEPYQQMVENNRNRLASHLSPVILVPGLLGSRMEARSTKGRKRPSLLCSRSTNWRPMWMTLMQLVPVAFDCWLDIARLEYDPQTGYTRPPKGVEARVPDFGSVRSVRHLDMGLPEFTRYYAPLVERYEQLGYIDGFNLRAAPYDFRLAPQQLADYFEQLKGLVERTQYEVQNGKKVTLVCHSMGCTHLWVFLRMQSAEWRQSRVRKVLAFSSPWGGAIKALKALVVGDNLDSPFASEAKIRKLARNYPSVAFLLPQPEVFNLPNKRRVEPGGPVMVQTPTRSYRASDVAQLLRDLGLDIQAKWYEESVPLIKPLEPLDDVHVDCIHGLNIPTPETMVFRNESEFPDGKYELVKGEGDGTVNYESLMVCADWAKRLPNRVRHKIILSTNHLGVLSHSDTLTHVTDDVLTN